MKTSLRYEGLFDYFFFFFAAAARFARHSTTHFFDSSFLPALFSVITLACCSGVRVWPVMSSLSKPAFFFICPFGRMPSGYLNEPWFFPTSLKIITYFRFYRRKFFLKVSKVWLIYGMELHGGWRKGVRRRYTGITEVSEDEGRAWHGDARGLHRGARRKSFI